MLQLLSAIGFGHDNGLLIAESQKLSNLLMNNRGQIKWPTLDWHGHT